VSGPDHPKTANLLSNLGNTYRVLGDYAQAEQLHKRALAIFEKTLGPDHPWTAVSLDALGATYQDTGAYSMAATTYERAVAILQHNFGLENAHTVSTISSLASIYHLMGDNEKAEPLLLQSLSLHEKLFGTDNSAFQLAALGDFYADMGAFVKAEPYYVRALGTRQHLLGVDNPLTAASLYALGSLYANTGQLAKSEALHLQALSIRERTFSYGNPQVIKSVYALASLSWRNGSTTKALQLFTKAQAMEAKNAEHFLVTNTEVRRRAYLQTHNSDVFKLVTFSVMQPTREGIALGLTSVLQYKGRLLDESTDNSARLRNSMNATDHRALGQLTEVATRLSNLTYQPDALSPVEYKQKMDLLLQRQETLEAELAKSSSEFRTQATPITVTRVRGAIPKDAAVVEWFRYTPFDPKAPSTTAPIKSRYVAYVVKRDTDPEVIDIGEAQAIESLVQNFRSAASDSRRTDIKMHAMALSEKLTKPLRPYLSGINHLLVSPDGALNLVPVAALLDEGGEYLAKRYEISYLTSGRDLLNIDAKTNSGGDAVVIADPEFGASTNTFAQASSHVQSQRSIDLDRGGLIFRPLANTALEAQELKRLLNLKASNVLLQSQATEFNVKHLHAPRILHIASHGFFLNDQELTNELKKRITSLPEAPIGENPLLRSGIALADANTRHSGKTDDGILTALEVAQLDLHGTELVVLSACDSGVGDVQNGEGVYGLRRSLVLAGAQTQITSLWKVSDEATRMLMIDYYQRLLHGEGRSVALLHAQQSMIASPNFSHPYYWASFIPLGNWLPLATQQ
jgi:CHAT domain-containing protein